jgi:hypothetical protein
LLKTTAGDSWVRVTGPPWAHHNRRVLMRRQRDDRFWFWKTALFFEIAKVTKWRGMWR